MSKVIWNPGETLGEVEKKVIAEAMTHYVFDRNRVSGVLGISRRTLDTRIAELKLESLEIDHKKRQEMKITSGLGQFQASSMAQMEFEEEQRLIRKAESDAKNKGTRTDRNR